MDVRGPGRQTSTRGGAHMTEDVTRPPTARDMRVLLIGAPGAGKGTQAVKLAAHFGVTHISSGDILRQHIAEGTTIGRAVSGYVERGDLVPDSIIMDMLFKPVQQASAAGGYILD